MTIRMIRARAMSPNIFTQDDSLGLRPVFETMFPLSFSGCIAKDLPWLVVVRSDYKQAIRPDIGIFATDTSIELSDIEQAA